MLIVTMDDVITQLDNAQDANLFLVAASSSPIFRNLLIQPLSRPWQNRSVYFLTLRNITVDKAFQGKGECSRLLAALESANARGIPVMVEDVISDILRETLIRRGWQPYVHQKQGDRVRNSFILS